MIAGLQVQYSFSDLETQGEKQVQKPSKAGAFRGSSKFLAGVLSFLTC
jgi:hypothetical protein